MDTALFGLVSQQVYGYFTSREYITFSVHPGETYRCRQALRTQDTSSGHDRLVTRDVSSLTHSQALRNRRILTGRPPMPAVRSHQH